VYEQHRTCQDERSSDFQGGNVIVFEYVVMYCRTSTVNMDLRDVRWGGMDWIDLAQNRDKRRELISAVMNFGFSQNEGNFLTS